MNRDFHQFLDVYQENNPLNDPYYLRRLTIFLKEAQQAMDEANPDSADFIKQYLIQTAKLRLIANNISEAAQRYTPGFNFILQAAQRAEAACIKANARAFRLEATPDSIL